MSKSSNQKKDLYTTEEAAERLGVTVRHVQELCRNESLDFGRKYGRTWMITHEQLTRYARTRRRPGRPRKS